MLVISTQNWSILAKFATKIQRNRLFFTDCFLAKFSPEISREIGRFVPENPSKFDFFPLKSCEIGRFFCEFLLSPAKIPRNRPIFKQILTFFPENPAKSADFSANLPLKIPRNFAFFCREISEALQGWFINTPLVIFCARCKIFQIALPARNLFTKPNKSRTWFQP